jgi:hypothetical protein
VVRVLVQLRAPWPRRSRSSSFGAVIFELAAGHIMASPAMHESHLPSWTSPHIRIMLSSIFNAQGTAGMALSLMSIRLDLKLILRAFAAINDLSRVFCIADFTFLPRPSYLRHRHAFRRRFAGVAFFCRDNGAEQPGGEQVRQHRPSVRVWRICEVHSR